MLHSILPMFHTARVDPDRFLCVRIISNRISLDKLQLRARSAMLCCMIRRRRKVKDNRSVQLEVNRRQQFINQSVQLGRVNDALIRALAASAVSNKDDKLRDLLAQNGITINPTTGAPEREAAPATAAPAATGR